MSNHPETSAVRPKAVGDRATLTISETAAILGIGESLAYELVARGDLPAIRVGQRRLVVPKSRLDDFLRGGAKSPAAEDFIHSRVEGAE